MANLKIINSEGRLFKSKQENSELAALKYVHSLFGKNSQAIRITGKYGEPGEFKAFRWTTKIDTCKFLGNVFKVEII